MPKVLDFKNKVSSPFQIKNASETKAEIIIYGVIGDDYWDEGAISSKKFSDMLGALPKTIKNIDVRLNSPGGSVFDGVAIYERLKQHPANVTVYVDGIAASIASIIAMAGNEIIIGSGSFMMIHKPLTMTWGNTDAHEANIKILDNIEHQMLSIYAKKTGLSKNELSNMLIGDGTWMNSDDCLKNGFCTSISDDSENLKVAASLLSGAKWLEKTNPPKIDDSKALKAKAEEIKNRIDGFITKKK